MRWKQFFTPVKSFNADEAKKFISQTSDLKLTLLDVRQPAEYQSGHIPGAKLIPLGALNDRINEIDPKKPTIVYCAIGGRSRVASQMLVEKGFNEVYNLTGGIKAWNNEKALGSEETGLSLFTGKESQEETLIIAYSLEAGLREFYLSMIPKIKNDSTRQLFKKLSVIEENHQNRIFDEYMKVAKTRITREEFEKTTIIPTMEGGLTTGEYLKIYQPDLEVAEEVISLAMAIEAQALDLYQRASDRAKSSEAKKALTQIAKEERTHLELLGKLFE